MSYHIYDEYYFDIPHENTINPFSAISNAIHPIENANINNPLNNNLNNLHIHPNTSFTMSNNNNNPWRPNEYYRRIYDKFQLSILKEYPDTPCIYCGRLLYKNKATRIPYDHSEIYPIERVNQINVLESYGTLRRQILKVPS